MASKRVIGFHYTVTGSDGEELDSSVGDEPLYILEGAHEIVPGLEKALVTMGRGERRTVAVPAAEAYGEHDPRFVLDVSRDQFPADADLSVGDQFGIEGDDDDGSHGRVFTVVEVNGDNLTIDGNHPLAGQDLVFDVEIVEVRDATREELEHGHAHGAHGHGHDH